MLWALLARSLICFRIGRRPIIEQERGDSDAEHDGVGKTG